MVDTCAGCSKGSHHVDLTRNAFSTLASLDTGILNVDMRPARLPSNAPWCLFFLYFLQLKLNHPLSGITRSGAPSIDVLHIRCSQPKYHILLLSHYYLQTDRTLLRLQRLDSTHVRFEGFTIIACRRITRTLDSSCIHVSSQDCYLSFSTVSFCSRIPNFDLHAALRTPLP